MRTETLTPGADNFSQPGSTEDFLVNANAGDDNVRTGNGRDTVYGGQGADTIFGMGAADLIYGNQGADVIYGNLGDDRIYGGQDSDRVYGGQGSDVVYGNLGDDVIYGNLGNDVIYGGQGVDIMYGGQGDDKMIGGLGSNTYIGGLGYDNAVVTGNASDYRFREGANGSYELIAKDGSGTQFVDGSTEQVTFANGQYLALRDIPAYVDRAPPPGGNPPSDGGGSGPGPQPPTPDVVTFIPHGTIDARGQNAASGNSMYYGAGNPPDHFAIARNTTADVELALRAHNRTEAGSNYDRLENGIPVYQVKSGLQVDNVDDTKDRTWASVDFSIVTGIDNDATPMTINQLVARGPVELWIDTDLGAGTNYAVFRATSRGTGGTGDYEFVYVGDPTKRFSGDEVAQPNYVDQNSFNLGFASIRSLIDGNPTQAGPQPFTGAEEGMLDFVLQARGDDGQFFQTHLKMQIGDGVFGNQPA